jgi:ribosomal-protein-alanine N-acetyltransferase
MQPIKGKRIFLRPLKYSDREDIFKNARDKEVSRWTYNIPYPYTKNDAHRFIRYSIRGLQKKQTYLFAIVLNDKERLVGAIEIKPARKEDKKAEIGYWIGKAYWGQGIASEAIKLVLIFAFKKLKLHRLSAGVFKENPASKKVLLKNGFKLEGCLREARFKFKKWHDIEEYGIIVSEFN